MVNHYVLLYMGVYNINCPYVYFSLLVALEILLSGWGTWGEVGASKNSWTL